jgi:hypothetical protein
VLGLEVLDALDVVGLGGASLQKKGRGVRGAKRKWKEERMKSKPQSFLFSSVTRVGV